MTAEQDNQNSEPRDATTVGNYFVANYPPFSFWSADDNDAVAGLLDEMASPARPLGLYVHIPFCAERCRYCYYLAYDKRLGEAPRDVDYVCENRGFAGDCARIS